MLRVYLEIPCDRLGILSISSILPQILPQTSSQTQGNSRVSRMEHQTPSVFPGNFRKRKVLGTLCFPFCLSEENLVQAKVGAGGRDLGDVGERAHDVVGDARPQPRRGDDDGEHWSGYELHY